MAQNAYEEGMGFYNAGEWENAIQSFDNAIYNGEEALTLEGVDDAMDEIGPDIPNIGDGIDIDSIGQGVRPSDLPLLWGIIIISVFVIIPVTYKLV